MFGCIVLKDRLSCKLEKNIMMSVLNILNPRCSGRFKGRYELAVEYGPEAQERGWAWSYGCGNHQCLDGKWHHGHGCIKWEERRWSLGLWAATMLKGGETREWKWGVDKIPRDEKLRKKRIWRRKRWLKYQYSKDRTEPTKGWVNWRWGSGDDRSKTAFELGYQ